MASNLRDIYIGVNKSDKNRSTNDFYPTPPLATYVLVSTVGKEMPKKILEPCAGRGHISIELIRNGFEVTSCDLNHYENCLVPVKSGIDALELPFQGAGIGIVTNPPYFKNLPHKMAEKFVNEYDFVAFFVRLTYLEGKRRKKIFTDHPPSDIIFLSDRINFGPTATNQSEPVEMNEQIGGMIAYAWVIWNQKKSGQQFHWALLEDYYPAWRKQFDVKKKLNIKVSDITVSDNLTNFFI